MDGYLCIDIGTGSIKVVEKDLSGKILKWGILERQRRPFHTSIQPLDPQDAARNLKMLLERMWAKATEAVFSMPAFLVFTAVADTSESHHIPADPQLFQLRSLAIGGGQFFLVATPKAVIEKYQTICWKLGLKLAGLEPESVALAGTLGGGSEPVLIVDIGQRSTTLLVARRGTPRFIEQTDFAVASNNQDVILKKVKNVAESREIRKIIFTGGGANLFEFAGTVASHPRFDIVNGLQRSSL